MLLVIPLVAIWVVLLLRYPARAVWISLGSLSGLVVIAGLTLWLDHREQRWLEALDIRVTLDTRCPAERPLHVQVHNTSARELHELRWQLSAHRSGERDELLASPRASAQSAPDLLHAGEQWQQCLPLPPLRPGYPRDNLQFEVRDIRGRFG